MIRSFIGIPIPNFVKDQLKPLYKILEGQKELKLVEIENLHITLKFLGEIKEEMIEKIDFLLSKIEFESFYIVLKNTGAFFNRGKPTVFFVDIFSDRLPSVFKKVEESLVTIGFKEEKKDFKPHLTIARVKGNVGKSIVHKFLNYPPFDIRFKIDKFILYKSDLTPTGPIYTELKSYNLI